MKRFILLVFISSFNVFSQTKLFSQNPFDVIMWFPPTMTEKQIKQFSNNFNATEIDKTMPSQARLWRFPAKNNSIDSKFNYNTPSEGIGTVTGHTSSVGGASQSNSPISLPPQEIITNVAKGIKIEELYGKCPNFDFNKLTLPSGTQSSVKIAILDTGLECEPSGNIKYPVNLVNSLIKPFVWINQVEIRAYESGTGIDNDNNGCIDDFNGWNFEGNNNLPDDRNGHGTAVAGIISQRFESSKPCEIVPVKVLNDKGKGTLFNLIKGIDYATRIGVDIMNISVIAQDNTPSPRPLDKAIEKAEEKQILVVCGAGNDNANLDRISYTPPSGDGNNLIVVGAARCELVKSDFSNYSQTKVDLFAPGENIPSIRRLRMDAPNYLVECTGTSFSAPYVSGIAAVLRTHQTNRDYNKLKSALYQSITYPNPLLPYSVKGGIPSSTRAYTAFISGSR